MADRTYSMAADDGGRANKFADTALKIAALMTTSTTRNVPSNRAKEIMMLNRRAAAQYGEVMVETGVSGADGTQLIQMLLDGLIESLNIAEGHIKRKAIAEKSFHLTRAGRIVLGLQNALDFEHGGDIARTLSELYQYVTRRLLHINIKNDLEALNEVRTLMQQVRDAWALVPSLVAPARRAM